LSVLADGAIVAGALLVFALLLAGPAWLVADVAGLAGLLVAFVLCVIPVAVSVIFRSFVLMSHATAYLASSGCRLFLVMGGVLLAKWKRPELGLSEFLVWIILLYLFALLVETLLTMKRMGQLNSLEFLLRRTPRGER